MVQGYVNNVRVYASGQNLVTFTNTGVIMWILPWYLHTRLQLLLVSPPRSVMFGVNISF